MKSLSVLIATILVFALAAASYGQEAFNASFLNDTLRVDYYHMGDARHEVIVLDHLYRTKGWAGNTINLKDSFNLGTYCVKVYDAASRKLLFSRYYGTIFEEYQTTRPGIEGKKKVYHESVLVPFPRKKILLCIESRDKKQVMREIFRTTIDPEDMYIISRNADTGVEVTNLYVSGDCHQKVDVLFVAEGYTGARKEKFLQDCNRLMAVFLAAEPYCRHKSSFNFRAVFRPSSEMGCDEPSYASFKNTAVECSFDSLGSERYLLAENNKQLRDIAGNAPYDALIILVNTPRYGGGGIFNLYATCISDNQWTDYVFLHEFGHSFTGLADEYYVSSTSYDDFYPLGTEPLSPNITALLAGRELKWKGLVKRGTSIPTAWDKDRYEKNDRDYQKERDTMNEEIARARKSRADDGEIRKIEAEREKLSRESAVRIDRILMESKNYNVVGAFEGAGYKSKGLFRPMVDCIMFSKGNKPFCAVCQKAIEKRIFFYCE